MADCYSSRPITILGRYFPSIDSCCLCYGINRSNCLKEAKQRGLTIEDVVREKAEELQGFHDMRQNFALGLYTRKK